MITLDKYCKSSKDIVEFSTPDNIKFQSFDLDENYMVKLSKSNAEKAHICVRNDTRYKVSPDKEYYKNIGKKLADYTLEELNEIIRLIATSNSTRSPRGSIDVLAEYIYQNIDSVLEKLDKGDIGLIEKLSKCRALPRKEKSLISKICAYLCEYECEKYNFIINDSVVRGVLPYYLSYYNIDKGEWAKKGKVKKLDDFSYSQMHSLISKIKDAVSDELTLRDIDHILWYCYKDDRIRTAVANEIALKNL